MIHNEDNGNCPFAFSYGVMGRYRLSHRLHLTMEVNGTTTFKDFDGCGASREFGDNLVSLTAGLSVTLGKSGWKKWWMQNPTFSRMIGCWDIRYRWQTKTDCWTLDLKSELKELSQRCTRFWRLERAIEKIWRQAGKPFLRTGKPHRRFHSILRMTTVDSIR